MQYHAFSNCTQYTVFVGILRHAPNKIIDIYRNYIRLYILRMQQQCKSYNPKTTGKSTYFIFAKTITPLTTSNVLNLRLYYINECEYNRDYTCMNMIQERLLVNSSDRLQNIIRSSAEYYYIVILFTFQHTVNNL